MKYYVIVKDSFSDKKYAYGSKGIFEHNTGDTWIKCSECNRSVGQREWLPPLDMGVSKKRSIGDVIYAGSGFTISKRFKEKFEQSDLRGLSNYRKLSMYYKKQPLDIEYYYSDIAKIPARIDESYVEYKNKKREGTCSVCQFRGWPPDIVNGIVFPEPEKIDQDIFYSFSLGSADIIVSERFKTFVKQEGFTNIIFWDADKFHSNGGYKFIFPDGRSKTRMVNGRPEFYENYEIIDNQVIIYDE
jgi:hypothetical protein